MTYELANSTWDDAELNAMQRVMTGGIFSMGKEVAEFEEAFAKRFGAKYAVMVNSGSSANLVGVASLFFKKNSPLQRGDEVIVPAISWATTFHPLQQYGLKLKFLDVELDSLNMDVSQLEKALTPKTKMVMAVSILGNPAALDVMRDFCDKHNLILFEDNCESMGATLNQKNCGTFGDIGTFSTFFSHHISTMEGGVILTNDAEISDLCRSIRNHGWTRGLPDNTSIYQKTSDDFFESYRFILPGYNVRPGELNGAIGKEQLKKLDAFIDIRRKNGKLFQKLFAGDDRFIIQKENGQSSWFSFPIILNPTFNFDREAVMSALKKSDIQYRIITGGNFLRHDVIKYYDYETVGEIVNANIAHDHGFFVGNHPVDLTKELHELYDVLDKVCVVTKEYA